MLLSSIYKGLLRFKSLYIIDTATYLINLILCFLLLKLTKNIQIIFLIFIFSQVVAITLLYRGLRRIISYKSKKFDFKNINSLSANLYGTRYVQFALGRDKDILLIGYFIHNPIILGFYSIATKLAEAINNLFTMGFGEVTQPSFSEAFMKKGEEGLRKLWYAFMRLEMFLTIPCLVFAIFHAGSIISLFYSDKYLSAVPIFQLFCVMILISCGFLGGGTSEKVLYVVDKQNLVLLILFLSGVFNIMLALILIPIYGALGSAFAAGFSMVIWVVAQLLVVIRLIKANFPLKFLVKITSASLVAMYLSQLIDDKNFLLLFMSISAVND